VAGRSRIGLVLNGKGYDRALGTAVDEVNVAMSVTDGFGLKNQGLSVVQQVEMLAGIIAGRANAEGEPGATPSLSATLSCVWGCPFDGEVSEGQVEDLVGRIAALGVDEIALADTIGVGDPWSVTKKVEAARRAAPDATLRLHFHDTRNTGLANAYAGVEAGIDILDASVGGIGGCPFAPGATGNIATEDLVYMLERAGYSTGYDLDALIGTALDRREDRPPGPQRPEPRGRLAEGLIRAPRPGTGFPDAPPAPRAGGPKRGGGR
jgi:hydroxymethylglutaryl-CoA lyase